VRWDWIRRREGIALSVIAGSLVVGFTVGALGTGTTLAAVPTQSPTPDVRALPTNSPAPIAIRTCSIEGLSTDTRLGEMHARVMNASTGEILLDRDGASPNRTASVMKVVTSAAALAVLGPDHRFTTRVVRGEEPGSVVLIGGGDPTLTDLPSGSNTIFGSVAHLDDLAAQTRAAWDADPETAGTPITSLVVDVSRYSGPDWNPTWNYKELGDGTTSKVAALMVNTGRADANANTSPRDEDPVGRAASAFADLLGGASVTLGVAAANAPTLAEVASPTIGEMLPQILLFSDNTAADALAFETAIATGSGNSFEALATAFPQALAEYGLDTAGMVVVDGSGLSDSNAVSPAFMTQLFAKIYAREANLGLILDNLPVSREKGSLAYSDRFVGDNAVVAGRVWAKTGWIDSGYTLGGIVLAADETPLTFAIYALGNVTSSAKQAIDNWVVGVYACGNKLANF
jgi:D-alanyl-D-alanine carboxypeptidase/D-alanyl-D-alanine-endopeptidase (penicillin-binding protein 4)